MVETIIVVIQWYAIIALVYALFSMGQRHLRGDHEYYSMSSTVGESIMCGLFWPLLVIIDISMWIVAHTLND